VAGESRTDHELVAAANAGDAAAFEALYRRHRDWVVRLAWRFTGSEHDALDVLQETFAYLFGKFPGFRLTARMTTFLYPVVRNLSLNRLRKSRREAPLPDEAERSLPARGEPAPGAHDDLRALLASLPDGEREVLLLRFADGLAIKEIAEALGIPLGTVKSRLHNALRALRDDPRTKNFFDR